MGAAADRLARDDVQLVGTLFFNVTTYRGMVESLDAAPSTLLAWRPDALGSICFLVASWLAYAEAGNRWLSWRPRDLGWTIAALNLLGSVFFGLSAVGAYVVPETGELLDVTLANAGTFLGAICFLLGAALLLPEASRRSLGLPIPEARARTGAARRRPPGRRPSSTPAPRSRRP